LSEHRVALLLEARGRHAEHTLRDLGSALGRRVPEPDDVGVVEVVVDAPDQEAALQHVADAVAAAGADDHLFFLEHPDLPEHWRHRARPASDAPP
jgi:hypothetical protein